MKRALAIGIDDYAKAPLKGCVADAVAMAEKLETNGDGSPNFHVRLLTSDKQTITAELMLDAVTKLFHGDAETVLLYFAGHGIVNAQTNAGYLVSQDGTRVAWGISLSDILVLANGAYPKIKSTVIILDSCQSGHMGEVSALKAAAGSDPPSFIGTGVTILTACEREGEATELDGHGLYTGLMLEGMSGSASDVLGRITPAALYTLIDQTLAGWEQRPVYKANVQSFVVLREVAPKIAKDVLRRLTDYFPNVSDHYKLDPSFEPDRKALKPAQRKRYPNNSDNQRIFGELQQFNRHGLVVPVDAEHMFFAAMGSTGCRLTALGAHYWKLAKKKRL